MESCCSDHNIIVGSHMIKYIDTHVCSDLLMQRMECELIF